MMLLGFGGLFFVGYRKAKNGRTGLPAAGATAHELMERPAFLRRGGERLFRSAVHCACP